MTTVLSSGYSGGNASDSVTLVLDLLLEEVEAERAHVKCVGADAFRDGDHDGVEASLAQSKMLEEFHGKAAALRKEWQKLASSASRGKGGKSGSGRRNLGKLRKGLRTPEPEFIEPILRVLIEMGGHGRAATVVARVGEVMQPILCGVDYEALSGDGKPRWEKAANWARRLMVLDGLLKSDSPHGIWEISEEGRAHLGS